MTDSDGQPLPAVLVFVDDGAATVLTDDLGMFGLSGIALERHVLGYRRAGFAPRSFSLDLTGGEPFRDVGTVVLGPGPTPTVTLRGIVTDGDGGAGLGGATVALNGRVIAVTDSLGNFDVPSSPVVWGPNELTVEHRAFSDRAVHDRVWIANLDETFDFTIALGIVPVALPEVGVEIPSRVLAENGFYERREAISTADFLTGEEVRARNPRRMGDLLRGVLTAGPEFNRAATSFGRADDGQPCLPVFFIDGLQLTRVSVTDLDGLLHPDDIEGIEIYRGIAGLPPRFAPIGAVCGVVVFWTR